VADLLKLVQAYEEAEVRLGGTGVELDAVAELKQRIDLGFLKTDVPALLRESLEGTSRVRKIVHDLNDFSRQGNDDEWQWMDLHQALDGTLNIVNNEIKYKAQVIRQFGELPEVLCLPNQINQVFMNLLVNAAQAIEDKGLITVSSGRDGGQVWVEVSDTGKGIAPEHLHRIFDPFFTTKPVGKGTGLGLSVSYSVVQKHHGEIRVDSALGQGTRFRVILPIRQPEQFEL
jgi:signal transduction histidine kinase